MTSPASEASAVAQPDGYSIEGSDGYLDALVTPERAQSTVRAQLRWLRPATPSDRLLVIAVGGYGLLVAGFMALHGIGPTLDVVVIAFGLAGLLAIRSWGVFADRLPVLGRELLPLPVLLLAYELMRGYAGAGVGTIHSADILGLERTLFFGVVPTQVLQEAFHHPDAPDALAVIGTVFYGLHFVLPPAVGALLWWRRPAVFREFMAGLIVLSIAGFATYLLLPVAPPWYAAETGALLGPGGGPGVEYLKADGFAALSAFAGLDGSGAFQFAIRTVNPDLVGAFPSLHAGYPVLAFFALRRAFGRPAWGVLVYAAAVWLAVIYLGDHYVVDVLGGIGYACAAAWLVRRPELGSLVGGPA